MARGGGALVPATAPAPQETTPVAATTLDSAAAAELMAQLAAMEARLSAFELADAAQEGFSCVDADLDEVPDQS